MSGSRANTPFSASFRPSNTAIPRQPTPTATGQPSTSPLRASHLAARPASSFTHNSTTGIPTFVPSPTRSPQPAHRIPGYPFGGHFTPASTGSRPTSSGNNTTSNGVFQTGITPRNRHPSLSSSAPAAAGRLVQGEWSFFGATLVCSGLRARADDAAAVGTNGASMAGDLGRRSTSAFGDKELFTASFGGDRWKLEIVKHAVPPTGDPATPQASGSKLSLYLFLDTAFSPIYNTSLFFGIRGPKQQIGKRDSKDGWVWREWAREWCFGTENDYFECDAFPSFEDLLQNPEIAENDAFVLSIQIQSPISSPVPQLQDALYIPLDLFGGLENLVDDRSTGDVLILVHERQLHSSHQPSSDIGASSSSGGEYQAPEPLFRKRALYAHAAVLKARSSYFADMLSAGWAETSGGGEERRRNVIKIEDFDYTTVSWLIQWLYTNQITFSETEDVRLLPDIDLPEGWLQTPSQLPWDWFPISALSCSTGSASLENIPESSERGSPTPPPSVAAPVLTTPNATPSAKAAGKRSSMPTTLGSPSPSLNTSKPRRPLSPDPPSPTRHSSHAGRISPLGGGRLVPSRPAPTLSLSDGDPHRHPALVESPASALAMYKIAHRYSLPGLATLALGHLVETLTPRTAFPLLLSTHLWPDLHSAIKSYALAHYFEVCQEPEFSRCYAEVGEGLWEHGGEVLLDFTLQLTPAWTQ